MLAFYLCVLMLAVVAISCLPLPAFVRLIMVLGLLVTARINYSRQCRFEGRALHCIGVSEAGWFLESEGCTVDIPSVKLLSPRVVTLKYRYRSRVGYLFLAADMMSATDFHDLKLALQFGAV
nr:hypothetical protein [Sinobacterium norvegicum]